MAAGFWTKLYYKVSEHSKYYFIVLLVANVGLMVASLIVFLIFGSYTIEDDKGNVVKTGTEEMSRGFYYMIITLFIMAASQFYVGIHSVGNSSTRWFSRTLSTCSGIAHWEH